MRLFTKIVLVSGVGIGLGVYASSGDKNQVSLPADVFNQSQDLDLINENLRDLSKSNVAFFRLRSCPYCAIVSAMLDYGRVSYHNVWVDPLTSSGMPSIQYGFVPILQFMKDPRRRAVASDPEPQKHGAFLVDSEEIVKTLAAPLGFARQLDQPKIQQSRAWIKERFVRSTFVAMNSSYAHAWASFPGVVPERYQYAPCRAIGSGVLFLLAKYKVLPKLKAASAVDGAKVTDPSIALLTGEEFLKKEAHHFATKMIPEGKNFHGGNRPDIVDVELYGVVRSTCQQSGPARVIVERSALSPWADRMREYVPTTKQSAITQ